MVELIHLHIHKTGGHSIYKTYKSVYGKGLGIPYNRGKLFRNNPNNTSLLSIIPGHIRVLYGHLEYKHVRELVEKYNPKIITWLRDPVERVISNYYFDLRKHFEGKRPNYSNETSLIDYSRKKSNRNLMSTFLDGINPEELFFIGTIENYDADVATLAKMLNWKKYRTGFHENDNRKYKNNPRCKTKTVTQEMRDEISALNREDENLYRRALELREKHIKKYTNKYTSRGVFNSIRSFFSLGQKNVRI